MSFTARRCNFRRSVIISPYSLRRVPNVRGAFCFQIRPFSGLSGGGPLLYLALKSPHDFRVEFSQSISGFTETHYEYLKKLYPNAKNNAELAKLAISDVLIYTSMVLTDRKKSRKLCKGIYKKTADGLAYKLVDELSEKTISVCPITYEHWGFMKPILENKDNPNAVIVLDCPYLRQFLLSCGDYKSEFGMEHLRQIFRTLKNAKCKVVLFNYKSLDYESLAEEYGFRLAGTYGANGGKSTEETLVYSLNITPDEKFFDPPKNSKNSN